jgi:hypothetical protein
MRRWNKIVNVVPFFAQQFRTGALADGYFQLVC